MKKNVYSTNGFGAGTLQAAACSLSIFALCVPAAASQTSVLEEVVVTAQKREQSLQDVGIAITAFTGDQMRKLGFENSFDIAAMTPGVHISGNNGGQKTLFTIRGVNQNDFNDQTESPVAVYVDETYIAFGQGQVFGLFDLDRVEILKGPQGTLFGRNATGGLVHFVTKKPTEETEGFIDQTLGSYGQVRLEGALGGSLSDAVTGRFSFIYKTHDEILENDYPNRFVTLDGNPQPQGGEDTFNDNTYAVRGQVNFEVTDNINWLFQASYSHTKEGTSPFLELPTVPIFDAAGNHVGTIKASPTETREAILPDGTPTDHPLSFDADLLRPAGGNLYGPSCSEEDRKNLTCAMDFAFSDLNRTESYGFTSNLTWDISDSIVFTSISDFKSFEKFQGLPADGGPASTINVLFESEAETFSQEFRLNGSTEKTRWVTGLYYLNVDLTANSAITADENYLFVPLVGVPWEDAAITELETNSLSVFGQVEYDFVESWTFIAGLRLIQENKDFTGQETFYASNDPYRLEQHTPLFSPQPKRDYKQDKTLWSAKVQLEWKPNEDLLIYAGFNRGVKAGGFNTPYTFGSGFPVEDVPYEEETLLAYETGFKLDGLFNGTTRLNASAYFYDYQDYQGFFFTQVTGFVRNVDAEYKGLEIELLSAPTDNFELSLGFSYIDAKVFDVQLGPGVTTDAEPSFTPKYQATGLVRYHWPTSVLGGNVALQVSVTHSSDFYDNIRNFDASRLNGYTVGNARATWISADDKWELSAAVQNLTDERYYTIGYDLSNATGSNSLVPGKPRWYSASVRYNF